MIQRVAASLVYSNVFVAVVLGVLTASSYLIVPELIFAWHVPLAVFFGSHMLYSFHRLYKIDFIPETQLETRHRWILQRERWVKYSMVFSMFMVLILLPSFEADAIIWLIPAGLISVGYTIPILPSEDGWRRFRDIPYTKPLIISLVVSYFTLAFPVFERWGIQSVLDWRFIQAYSERVLFILVVTLPFDMRDMRGDREAGLETLATHYGFSATRKTGFWVAASWMGIAIWRFVVSDFKWAFIAVPALILVLVLTAYYRLNESRGDLYYVFAFEGLILVYSVGWAALASFH